jgi:hypothetical protein
LVKFNIFYGHLEYFTDIWDILVQFVFIWYILSGFGIMHQEKSGNPASVSSTCIDQIPWQKIHLQICICFPELVGRPSFLPRGE